MKYFYLACHISRNNLKNKHDNHLSLAAQLNCCMKIFAYNYNYFHPNFDISDILKSVAALGKPELTHKILSNIDWQELWLLSHNRTLFTDFVYNLSNYNFTIQLLDKLIIDPDIFFWKVYSAYKKLVRLIFNSIPLSLLKKIHERNISNKRLLEYIGSKDVNYFVENLDLIQSLDRKTLKYLASNVSNSSASKKLINLFTSDCLTFKLKLFVYNQLIYKGENDMLSNLIRLEYDKIINYENEIKLDKLLKTLFYCDYESLSQKFKDYLKSLFLERNKINNIIEINLKRLLNKKNYSMDQSDISLTIINLNTTILKNCLLPRTIYINEKKYRISSCQIRRDKTVLKKWRKKLELLSNKSLNNYSALLHAKKVEIPKKEQVRLKINSDYDLENYDLDVVRSIPYHIVHPKLLFKSDINNQIEEYLKHSELSRRVKLILRITNKLDRYHLHFQDLDYFLVLRALGNKYIIYNISKFRLIKNIEIENEENPIGKILIRNRLKKFVSISNQTRNYSDIN